MDWNKLLDMPTNVGSTAQVSCRPSIPHFPSPRSHQGLTSLAKNAFHSEVGLELFPHTPCELRLQLPQQFRYIRWVQCLPMTYLQQSESFAAAANVERFLRLIAVTVHFCSRKTALASPMLLRACQDLYREFFFGKRQSKLLNLHLGSVELGCELKCFSFCVRTTTATENQCFIHSSGVVGLWEIRNIIFRPRIVKQAGLLNVSTYHKSPHVLRWGCSVITSAHIVFLIDARRDRVTHQLFLRHLSKRVALITFFCHCRNLVHPLCGGAHVWRYSRLNCSCQFKNEK